MKKKRILILGSYGCGNRGDEAILDSIALYFRDCDITATCGKDRRIQGDIPISYIDCRLAEGKVTFEIFLSFVKSVFQLFCKILSVDAVIFGGGSSLHDLKAYNLPFWLGLQLWANLFGKKTYYVGMGIGPISTGFGKFLCKHFLRHADKVFVRDQRGIDICLSLGLRNIVLANDAAFSKPRLTGGKTPVFSDLPAEPYICISACAWGASENWWRTDSEYQKQLEDYYRQLIDCCTYFIQQTGKPAVFVPSFCHDEKIGRLLEEAIPNSMCTCLPVSLSFQDMSEIVGNSYLLIGMRMHTMIFALRRGVPVIAINYDEKVTQLMNMVGLPGYVLDMDEMSKENLFSLYQLQEEHRDEVVRTVTESAMRFARTTDACLNEIRESIGLEPCRYFTEKEPCAIEPV